MSESESGGGLTEQAFRDELKSLIEAAHEDGLSIGHHWVCRMNDGSPDFEVEFVQLQEEPD